MDRIGHKIELANRRLERESATECFELEREHQEFSYRHLTGDEVDPYGYVLMQQYEFQYSTPILNSPMIPHKSWWINAALKQLSG